MSPAAAPPRWSLRRRLGRSFAILGVLLGLLGAAVVVFAVRFARDGNDVIYRWQPATATSQRLLADLINQETGVRGYVLTRQPDTLNPYTQYRLLQPHDERLRHHNPGFMVKPGPATIDTQDVVVPGRDGPIPARVYTRPGTEPGAPAILFIHGGGFSDLGVHRGSGTSPARLGSPAAA